MILGAFVRWSIAVVLAGGLIAVAVAVVAGQRPVPAPPPNAVSQPTVLPAPAVTVSSRPVASRASRQRVKPSAALQRVRPSAALRQQPQDDLAHAWANQPFSIKVANCESADLPHWPYSSGEVYIGHAHLRDSNGHFGKWQFDLPTWRGQGGRGNPADASEAEQDARAFTLWKERGWQPWTCARKL